MGNPLKQLKQASPGPNLLNKSPRQVSFLLNFKIPGSITQEPAPLEHLTVWEIVVLAGRILTSSKQSILYTNQTTPKAFPKGPPMCPALQGGNTLRVFSQLKKI